MLRNNCTSIIIESCCRYQEFLLFNWRCSSVTSFWPSVETKRKLSSDLFDREAVHSLRLRRLGVPDFFSSGATEPQLPSRNANVVSNDVEWFAGETRPYLNWNEGLSFNDSDFSVGGTKSFRRLHQMLTIQPVLTNSGGEPSPHSGIRQSFSLFYGISTGRNAQALLWNCMFATWILE
jgi:hypothetical protein